MINNSAPQKWQRLKQKGLEQQFIQQVCQGCGCSPFEAQAVLETVYEVFSPFFDNASSLRPGQVLLDVLSVEASPAQALAEAPQLSVRLTLFEEPGDLDIRAREGIVGLRHHRLQRLCLEAFQQGGLLTVEDLALRLFHCGERTICRDLKALRQKGIHLPLRSTIKDMGRSLSHRAQIVRCWLSGQEYSQIAQDTCHSIEAVRNYVDKFKRVVSLSTQGYDEWTISFVVKISSTLVRQYQELYGTLPIVAHRAQELQQLAKKKLS